MSSPTMDPETASESVARGRRRAVFAILLAVALATISVASVFVGLSAPARADNKVITTGTTNEAHKGTPFADRAALLVEAPPTARLDPSEFATYEGRVSWHVEQRDGGQGQPAVPVIHADIDIPHDNLKVAVTIYKNTEADSPAAYMMQIDFAVRTDTATGDVGLIGLPQVRREAAAVGDKLVGATARIIANSFLVALSGGRAATINLELLKQREWIDIPVVLSDGKVAKLTFEKGSDGQRLIEDAIRAWQAKSKPAE